MTIFFTPSPSEPLNKEIKRDDSVEPSRFFVFGESKEKRGKIRKAFFLFVTFGLVGLMCGSASGFRADNIIKLKETGNCQKCDLWNANLEWANLTEAKLYQANLTKANLRGADVSGANLEGANLSSQDLRNAYLSGANLNNADLVGANLSGADLGGANLIGANLSYANLSGANLNKANMKNIRNLDSAIKCKTIMPWGEDNSGCK